MDQKASPKKVKKVHEPPPSPPPFFSFSFSFFIQLYQLDASNLDVYCKSLGKNLEAFFLSFQYFDSSSMEIPHEEIVKTL
jgi:hypothetical protein